MILTSKRWTKIRLVKSRWFKSNTNKNSRSPSKRKKLKPLELSVEKTESFIVSDVWTKEKSVLQSFDFELAMTKILIQIVTNTLPNPMSKNNTDNLFQHLIK